MFCLRVLRKRDDYFGKNEESERNNINTIINTIIRSVAQTLLIEGVP